MHYGLGRCGFQASPPAPCLKPAFQQKMTIVHRFEAGAIFVPRFEAGPAGSQHLVERERRTDQTEMCKGLREVPQQLAAEAHLF
jgi:hypothetical protein